MIDIRKQELESQLKQVFRKVGVENVPEDKIKQFVQKATESAIFDLIEPWLKTFDKGAKAPTQAEIQAKLAEMEDKVKLDSVMRTFNRSLETLTEAIKIKSPKIKIMLKKAIAEVELSKVIKIK